ncbi:hypothetical protein [Nocardioides sp.]|uniref:hypothetical protein n=1 Tax=Nocardioides sp. TaxID=35761 RepID=UPI0031FE94B1|nr:hypothetical protein [Nocardioides sp.]
MQIMVNGQQYDSWDAVPPEIRQQLAAKLPDADKNGIPDLFEGGGLPMSSSSVITSTSFAVDGKTYDNVASLPAEVQAVLRNMLPGLTGAAAPAATPPLAVPAPAAAPAPTVGQPLAEGEVMLNGVPTRVGSEPARKKHWWRRG